MSKKTRQALLIVELLRKIIVLQSALKLIANGSASARDLAKQALRKAAEEGRESVSQGQTFSCPSCGSNCRNFCNDEWHLGDDSDEGEINGQPTAQPSGDLWEVALPMAEEFVTRVNSWAASINDVERNELVKMLAERIRAALAAARAEEREALREEIAKISGAIDMDEAGSQKLEAALESLVAAIRARGEQ